MPVTRLARHYLALVALLSAFALSPVAQPARAADLAGVTLVALAGSGASPGAASSGGTGGIGEVVVVSDTDRLLTLRIGLDGFTAGEIRAEAQTEDRRPIPHLPRTTVEVASADEPPASVEVALALAGDAPSGFSAASSLLSVVATPAEGMPGAPGVREFQLVKTWKTPVAPGDVVVRVTPQPIGTTSALLARLEGTGPTTEPAGDANTCFNAVQNRIAWNYGGSTGWADSNVADLCRGAETTQEPARCFHQVMHGGVERGDGTSWEWQPTLALCAGTLNAGRTVACFQRDIAAGNTWQAGIERCSASPSAPRPPVALRPDRPAIRPEAGVAVHERLRSAPPDLAAAVVAAPPEATPLVRAAPTLVRPDVSDRISHNVRLSSETSAATEKLPTFAHRVELAQFAFSRVETPPEPESTRPTNSPSNQPIDLLAGLTLAVPLSPADIMQIYDKVYLDDNEQSGVAYYIPRAYNVAWDREAGIDRGLGLRIAYEQTTGGETARAVRMAVLLDARVDLQEVQLARELLQLQSRRQGFPFRELRVFPLSAPPAVSLVDSLQSRFSLRADQVAINALSSALDQIELSWVTDPITAGNIRLTLRSGFGINGAAQFLPPNQDGPAPSIPVNIRLDSADTYGRFAFDRDGVMRNQTPFGLKLVHLHALIIENDAPAIYSWSLGGKVLPPKAKLEFDTAKLPKGVDENARLMWVSYAIDKSCESCVQDTIDAAVIGNVWPDTSQLSLRTLTPLADTATAKLEVRTRSRFFDPDSRNLRAGPVLIFEADGEAQTVDPIFLAERTPPDGGAEWPLFEYQVSAILPSGEVVEGRNWLPAQSERVFIGSFQLRQSTGAFGAPG